jgi:hypothetical protein
LHFLPYYIFNSIPHAARLLLIFFGAIEASNGIGKILGNFDRKIKTKSEGGRDQRTGI